jgi:hypothetical protein
MLHLFTTWTYYEKQYSPFRFPPTFRKHAAPRFRYAGSWAKGIPFKLDRNGRSRKMKRACMVQQQRFSVSVRQSKWFISQNGTRITRNLQRIIEYQEGHSTGIPVFRINYEPTVIEKSESLLSYLETWIKRVDYKYIRPLSLCKQKITKL